MSSCHLPDEDRDIVMTIDLKKRRLRLYRQTLHAIGDPDYILLLVNPEKHKFAIRRGKDGEMGAQKIYWTVLEDKRQCCEIYSTILVDKMHEHFFSPDRFCSYRVNGKVGNRATVVMFDLDRCTEISDEED